jgi:glycosyltransferase involved in cell wall biosynthesis
VSAPRDGSIDLTAIVPCLNEETNLERAYAEIKGELARYGEVELLFIDDGSTDSTLERIKRLAELDPCVKYLSLSRNFGHEAAFSAGFRYSRSTWTIQFDADMQAPASEAHKLIAKALEGYDAVFSQRERRRDPLHRRIGSKVLNWVARCLGIEMPRGAWAFRVVRTSVARRVVDLRLASPYFLATVPLLTDRWTTVPVRHRRRADGRARFRLKKLVLHAVDLFTGFSFRPLVAVYLLAVAGTLAATLLTIRAAVGEAPLSMLETAGLAAQAAMLVAIAITVRYVIRVIKGQARPPLYCVRESNLPLYPEDDLYDRVPLSPMGAMAVEENIQ